MFSAKDFKSLDRLHFDVLYESGYHIILRSKKSKHIWDLVNQELFWGSSTIMVMHKHHAEDQFHIQKGFTSKNLNQVQAKIIAHDKWHMGGRKRTGGNVC